MALHLSKSRTFIEIVNNRKKDVLGLINCFHNRYASNEGDVTPCNKSTLFSFIRLESTKAEKQVDPLQDVEDSEQLDFPGGKMKFTSNLEFLKESAKERVNCYRVLDDDGRAVGNNFIKVDKEVATKMYTGMLTLQAMDTLFYETQRQGRISFYLTTVGEEAINIASAAALDMDDLIFPQMLNRVSHVQYREPGVLLWRGFTLQEFANQCFSNIADNTKGRQMPIHYGSKKLNYFTVASTVGTQVLHAVGAAYGLKMEGRDACAVTYFGDGGSSTGDFHAALNFAAVLEVPVIFLCRNNGFAISTPVEDQFRSDGIVVRGPAYGVRSIRVDGTDALAVYNAVHAARRMAVSEQRPILIEAIAYRAGHHSTSDDSTKYRSAKEIQWWRTERDPVTRFRKWIEREGWWSPQADSEVKINIRKQLLQAIQLAEGLEKPPVKDIFSDVYDVTPSNLREQESDLRESITRYPEGYPSGFPF